MAALGEQLLFLRIEEEEKEEEEEEFAESRWAASSWSRWLPCPLLCDDRFWGARGVPAPHTMDFVEGLRGADRGVPMPQIMEVFVVPQITEEIMEGDSAGDKVVDMLVIVQRQVPGETEQKTEEVPQFRSHGVVQFFGQGC